MEDRVTFASVSFLEEGDTISLSAMESLDALRGLLDERVELLGANNLYIVRVDGAFRRVAARTELKQEPPFKKFAEMLAKDERRFVFENISGSLVCFCCGLPVSLHTNAWFRRHLRQNSNNRSGSDLPLP